MPTVDNSQVQQTKQELLEAYLDMTHAVASSISDMLDDQAADVTAIIPIIRQVRNVYVPIKEACLSPYLSVMCKMDIAYL